MACEVTRRNRKRLEAKFERGPCTLGRRLKKMYPAGIEQADAYTPPKSERVAAINHESNPPDIGRAEHEYQKTHFLRPFLSTRNKSTDYSSRFEPASCFVIESSTRTFERPINCTASATKGNQQTESIPFQCCMRWLITIGVRPWDKATKNVQINIYEQLTRMMTSRTQVEPDHFRDDVPAP